MHTKCNILIFGQNQECEDALVLLKQHFKNAKKSFQYTVSAIYDKFYQQIVDAVPA